MTLTILAASLYRGVPVHTMEMSLSQAQDIPHNVNHGKF